VVLPRGCCGAVAELRSEPGLSNNHVVNETKVNCNIAGYHIYDRSSGVDSIGL